MPEPGIKTKNDDLPIIGITMGDPAGIGPEIIVKALSQDTLFSECRPVVIGDEAILKRAIDVVEACCAIEPLESMGQLHCSPGTLSLYAVSHLTTDRVPYGKPNPETGKAMARYIKEAVRMATNHEIDAIVTAPINKKALQSAGCHYPGHTEMLAQLTRTDNVAMMLAGEKLKVVLVTIHCSFADVPALITEERILTMITIAHNSLKRYFSLPHPRIAVAGLNPHAGEQGIFGTEEEEKIFPAIKRAQHMGIEATGPYPADTLFYFAAGGKFDVVICMYHDQGLIPLKLLYFDQGVNITLGLPIIRTSVDHGTAYDIAGKAIADPSSLIHAIKTAVQMVRASSMQSIPA